MPVIRQSCIKQYTHTALQTATSHSTGTHNIQTMKSTLTRCYKAGLAAQTTTRTLVPDARSDAVTNKLSGWGESRPFIVRCVPFLPSTDWLNPQGRWWACLRSADWSVSATSNTLRDQTTLRRAHQRHLCQCPQCPTYTHTISSKHTATFTQTNTWYGGHASNIPAP